MIGNIPSETVSKIHLVDLAGSERGKLLRFILLILFVHMINYFVYIYY